MAEKSYVYYAATLFEAGAKELKEGLYDWVGRIHQEKSTGPLVDQTLHPIGLFYTLGQWFALFIGEDETNDGEIKIWLELLELDGTKANSGSLRVKFLLTNDEFDFTKELPISTNATACQKLPDEFEGLVGDMSHLVEWLLKVKVYKPKDPDPMSLPIKNPQQVKLKMLNKATQADIRPNVKNAATWTKLTVDQGTQTDFKRISLMDLMELVPKSTADANLEAKPTLNDSETQTIEENNVLEVRTNTDTIVVPEDKETSIPESDEENDEGLELDVEQIFYSYCTVQ